jgi:hypothetical protein
MAIDKYVSQLLEDIQKVSKPVQTWEELNSDVQIESEKIETDFADIEKYLSGDYEVSITSICGLEKEHFPAVELLTEIQVKDITEAFLQMMNSHNISYDFPENLPFALMYDLLRNNLDQKVFSATFGFTTIELCNYEKEECPYAKAGFCECKDYDAE